MAEILNLDNPTYSFAPGAVNDLSNNWEPIDWGNGLVQVGGNPYNPSNGVPIATGTGTTVTPAPDPYAQKKAAARNTFNQGRDVFNTSTSNVIGQAARNYQRGIQDWTTQFNQAQQGLDTKAINAEMAKKQGMGSILNMVGQGIRSGGVMLSNKNAGSSSAAQAIADAYARLGQQQASGVGNQYGQAMNQIGLDQENLNQSKATQMQRWNEDKISVVNGIVADAQRQIAALNEAAANAGIGDRMDIAAEAERIRQDALAQLQQYDSEVSKMKSAQTADERRNEAQRLMTLPEVGAVPQFNYSTQVPLAWQNSGPFSSELPIFTYGSNKYKAQA